MYIDYEDLILARQEAMDWGDDLEDDDWMDADLEDQLEYLLEEGDNADQETN